MSAKDRKITIYLIVLPTGLHGKDGVELVVPYSARLTRAAADEVAKKVGGRVDPIKATK